MIEIPIPIAVVLISIFVAIISFVVGILLKSLNSNTDAITEVKTVVNQITITLTKFEEQTKRGVEQETYIKEKLKEHTLSLKDHEKRLIDLEHED